MSTPDPRARELMQRHGTARPVTTPPMTRDLSAGIRLEDFPGYQEFIRQQEAFSRFGLRVLRAEPERAERLRANSRFFLERARALGLDTGPAQGAAVVPVILGNSLGCLQVAEHLFQAGIQVHPILYPAVPEEASRLRYFITAGHDQERLDRAARLTAEAVAKIQKGGA